MRIPWVTLSFVAVAAAAGFSPNTIDWLEYRQAAVSAGEWWRPFSAHLVHWSARMTAVDLGAVLLLGALLERRSRFTVVLAIASAILLVGLGLHFLPPPIGRYRGSSSVASALYVALALDLRRGSMGRFGRGAAAAMLALFVLKVCAEAWTGEAIFAGAMGAGVTVLPRAHLLGAAGGAVAWGAAARRGAGGRGVSVPSGAPSGPSSRSS